MWNGSRKVGWWNENQQYHSTTGVCSLNAPKGNAEVTATSSRHHHYHHHYYYYYHHHHHHLYYHHFHLYFQFLFDLFLWRSLQFRLDLWKCPKQKPLEICWCELLSTDQMPFVFHTAAVWKHWRNSDITISVKNKIYYCYSHYVIHNVTCCHVRCKMCASRNQECRHKRQATKCWHCISVMSLSLVIADHR